MSRTTTNYGFNISEGSDLVNPLTDIFPNFEDIDTDLKSVSDDAIGTATELLTGTVHALTRADSDRDCIRFTATSNFTAGETFTVDGVQVTALTPDGQTLATGSYIIGSEVFAILKGTLLTVYVSPAKAKDSDLLDGHDSTYFAKDSDMTDAQNDISTMSAKVGTGVLDTTAQNCVGAINELNSSLLHYKVKSFSLGSVTAGTKTVVASTSELTDGETSDYTKIVGCAVIIAGGNTTTNIGIAINYNTDSGNWLIVPTQSDTGFSVRVATLYIN